MNTRIACLVLLAAFPVWAQGFAISMSHTPPQDVKEGRPVVIEGTIHGASEVERAELIYRTSRTHGWRTMELELVSADDYRAEIPSDAIRPPSLEYYIVAIDFLENSHQIWASQHKPTEIVVSFAPATSTGPLFVVDEDPKTEPASEPIPRPESESEPEPKPELVYEPEPEHKSVPKAPQPQTPQSTVAVSSNWLVTRIDRERIGQMAARTLFDILELVPEVDILRTVDGNRRIAIRGRQQLGDVLVYVDDVLVNHPYDSAVPDMPAGVIDAVEVHRSPTADIDVNGGLAGTVRVYTVSHTTGWQASAYGGSHLSSTTAQDAVRDGSYGLSARIATTTETLSLTGFAGLTYTDGTQSTISHDAFSTTARLTQTPGPFSDGNMTLLGGGSLRFPSLIPGVLTTDARYIYEQRGGGLGSAASYGPNSSNAWHMGLLQIGHELEFGAHSLSWKIASVVHQTQRQQQLAPEGFRSNDVDGDGLAELFPAGVLEQTEITALDVTGEVRSRLAFAPHTLHLAGLFRYADANDFAIERNMADNGATQPFGSAGTRPTTTDRLLAAASVRDEWAIHPKVDFGIGFRFTYVSSLHDIEIDKQLNWRVGLVYRPITSTAVHVTYASSFRPPSMEQLGDQSAASLSPVFAESRYTGNPKLVGTATHVAELGLDWHRTTARVTYVARGGAYFQHIVNAVEAVPGVTNSGPDGGLEPISQRPSTDQLGAHVEGRVDFTSSSSLFVAGWWLRSQENHASSDGFSLLTTLPQMGALLGARIDVAELAEVNIFGRYGAERRNNVRTVAERLRPFAIPAAFVTHLSVRTTPLWKGIRLGASLHNLFDTAGEDPAPRPDLTDLVPREGFEALLTVEVGG